MWRTFYCLVVILATALLDSIDALTGDISRIRVRTNNQMTMLKDDGFKPKTITPNDIASLFGDSGGNSNKITEDYTDEDEDDFDYDKIKEEDSKLEVEKATKIEKPIKIEAAARRTDDADSLAIRELMAIQKEMQAPPEPVDIAPFKEFVEETIYERVVNDEEVDVDSYLNFGRELDAVRLHSYPTKTYFFL
jgi:hypothetical protein